MDRTDNIIRIGRHYHPAPALLALYVAVACDTTEREERLIECKNVSRLRPVPFEESGCRDQHAVRPKRIGKHIHLGYGLGLCIYRAAEDSAIVHVFDRPPDIFRTVFVVDGGDPL